MKLQITVAGKVFDVAVDILDDEDEMQEAIEANPDAASTPMTFPVPPMPGLHTDSACMSPVNGIVVQVLVEAGQRVQEGQSIMVLEAMKMETAVTAPRACVIRAVKVSAGQAVKAGQLLVEFD